MVLTLARQGHLLDSRPGFKGRRGRIKGMQRKRRKGERRWCTWRPLVERRAGRRKERRRRGREEGRLIV